MATTQRYWISRYLDRIVSPSEPKSWSWSFSTDAADYTSGFRSKADARAAAEAHIRARGNVPVEGSYKTA